VSHASLLLSGSWHGWVRRGWARRGVAGQGNGAEGQPSAPFMLGGGCVAWSAAGLPVIVSYTAFWSPAEAAILFAPLTARQCRERALQAGLSPAGRRPSEGRGRAALVYSADDWCLLLGGLLS